LIIFGMEIAWKEMEFAKVGLVPDSKWRNQTRRCSLPERIIKRQYDAHPNCGLCAVHVCFILFFVLFYEMFGVDGLSV